MDPNFNTYTEEKPSFGSNLVEFIQTLVVFAAIGTVIYLFIAQPHKVSGSSMFPNFKDGDYIITDKLTYKFSELQRGDVVVFRNPQENSQDFIKRVIALPGDKVRLESGRVFINDKPLNEPYIQPEIRTSGGLFLEEGSEVVVETGEYLVLGDNRPFSSDSRNWGFITKDKVIGKVFLRYWPQDAIGFYPAAYNFK